MTSAEYIGTSVAANCIKNMEGIGGALWFDETGVTFKPHTINIQRKTVRIEYADIASVDKRKSGGFIPNGISIVMKDGEEHKFVVNKRSGIIDFLNGMKNSGGA
jgi:hypothetical protein